MRFEVRDTPDGRYNVIDTQTGEKIKHASGQDTWGNYHAAYGWATKCESTGGKPKAEPYRNPYLGL